MVCFYKIHPAGNSAVGLAYKSGGLGVPGSNPGCPTGEFFTVFPQQVQETDALPV
jgi:hypothetical protein